MARCSCNRLAADDEKHLRVRIAFADHEREMRFVDQRTFGGVYLDELRGGLPRASSTLLATHLIRDSMPRQPRG